MLRYKFAAVAISGGLAGLGGGFLVLVSSGIYDEGQTGGRGYIGLASMVFGNWRPVGMLFGSAIFGYTDTIRLRSGGDTVHALLFALAVLLIVFAAVRKSRGGWSAAAWPALVAVGAALIDGWSDHIPSELTGTTLYVATLLVLTFASQRRSPPRFVGVPFQRGNSG